MLNKKRFILCTTAIIAVISAASIAVFKIKNKVCEDDVNYEDLLKRNCVALGLNYNSVITNYNGNFQQAYESTKDMMSD